MDDPAVGRARRAFAKKKPPLPVALKSLAERTGLEPATPGVTGRYSNQLNYHSWYFDNSCQPVKVASPRGFEPL